MRVRQPGRSGIKSAGYTDDELAAVPDGRTSAWGVGTQRPSPAWKPGETVLDLGSGGGLIASWPRIR